MRSEDETTKAAAAYALDTLMNGPMPLTLLNANIGLPTPSQGAVLITQFFIPKDQNALRNVQDALVQNLANNLISNVLLLNEVEYDFSSLPNYQKITQIVIGRRLLISDAFQAAREMLDGRIVIVANADIYFDDTIRAILSSPKMHDNSTVIALTKWFPRDEYLSLLLRTDSQDAWIFKSPLPQAVIEQSNFPLGAVKCDNRLANIFESASYRYYLCIVLVTRILTMTHSL
jgi:hypothetical protein